MKIEKVMVQVKEDGMPPRNEWMSFIEFMANIKAHQLRESASKRIDK